MYTRKEERFLDNYILLERAVVERFGDGGIPRYLASLASAGYTEGRGETLSHLQKYREIRNRLTHEVRRGSAREKIRQSDISRIKRLTREVSLGRDPLSRYLRRRSRASGVKRVFFWLLGTLLATAVATVLTVLINL